MSECGEITDAGAAELAKCAQLKSVDLSDCDKITDAGAAELVKCPQLKSVDSAATRSPTREAGTPRPRSRSVRL